MSEEQKQIYLEEAEKDKERYLKEMKEYRNSENYRKFRKSQGSTINQGVCRSESSYSSFISW